MTDFSVTLTIPEHVYERVRRMAEEKGVPVEQILIHQLETDFIDRPSLAPDEQAELDALTHLSDNTLWTIAREQFPSERQEQMQELMDRNNSGTISAEDREMLANQVEQGQRLMMRKAKAMALLMQRGYTITEDELQQN